MFGWSAQVAGCSRLDAFIERVSSRRYCAAGELLSSLEQSGNLTDEEAERGHELLHRIARLVEDQERLAEVASGLAAGEEQLRAELERLASKSSTCSPRGVPSTCDDDSLKVWLLGSCRLSFNGRSLDGDNCDQTAAIMRFLVAQPIGGVHKEQLAAVFWPESDERSARRNLHQAVYNIRRRLHTINADQQLVFVNDRYRLGTNNRWRDVDELERAMTAARLARDEADARGAVSACERVVDLYSGDFLSDHLYDEWAEGPRRHHRLLFREAADVLLNHWWKSDRLTLVVELAERLLGVDPTDEAATRYLMNAQDRLGRPELASAAFDALTETLSELGLPPSGETTAAARKLAPRLGPDEWALSV